MTATAPHNRIALVTGAGSGIGQGCATGLLLAFGALGLLARRP